MKKSILTLLAMVLVFGLALIGCGDGSGNGNVNGNGDTITIGNWTYDSSSDKDQGGTSTINMSQSSGTITMSGNVANISTAQPWGNAQMRAIPNTATLNALKNAVSISFKAKGDGKKYRVHILTSDITADDYCYYENEIIATSTEKTFTLNIPDDFAQPDWGHEKAFDKSKIEGIQFQAFNKGSYSLSIKDLTVKQDSGGGDGDNTTLDGTWTNTDYEGLAQEVVLDGSNWSLKHNGKNRAKGTLTLSAPNSTTGTATFTLTHEWNGSTWVASNATATANYNISSTKLTFSNVVGSWFNVVEGTWTKTGGASGGGGDGTYTLGDTGPGGGKIFYYSAEGFTVYQNATDTVGVTCHYLEAAPDDMTTTLTWASSGFTSTNITGTAEGIGTGRKNTALILATDANAPAAKACNEYSNNGKTDWFLPSRYELNQLYVNRTNVGNLKTTVDTTNWTYFYWSSSQSSSNAWYQNFSSGGQYNDTKDIVYSVRAVRAF